MENLTKENFWNKMQENYPKAMEKFFKWIDEYKEKNNWNELFAYHVTRVNDTNAYPPKYHDLPLAIQLGIYSEFVFAYSTEYEGLKLNFIDEVKEIIIINMNEINEVLK